MDGSYEIEANRIDAEITEFWGQLNAATFRFLTLIARFDRAQGWIRYGVANCVQWLNLKCGIGRVAALTARGHRVDGGTMRQA
jgi:hypothetical protein